MRERKRKKGREGGEREGEWEDKKEGRRCTMGKKE